jgi:hypothetical protein
MEEDYTPEQTALAAAYATVSEGLAEWAREQFREGYTVREVKQRLHDAVRMSGRD